MSYQPRYINTFSNLIYEVLEYKHWKIKDLETNTQMYRQKIYRCMYDYSNNKEDTLVICVALGLDLVSTMIFLISKGIFLNPIANSKDRDYMTFIDSNKKKDEFDRVLDWIDYFGNE